MGEISEKVKNKLFDAINSRLYAFGVAFCNDVITGEVPDFHKELCDLMLEEDRLVLAAPRGFSKSTWVSKIYPLWCACLKKRRDIVIISASEGLAIEHLRYVKQKLEQDQVLQAFFGNLVSDKWSESHIIVKHPDGYLINIRAKGAGGQIRGFRPDCIILDDIETDESVLSEEQRKKLKQWFFTACINCLLPGGQLVLIGTLIHPLSVLGDVLDTNNKWTKRKWQAYKDGIEQEGYELWAKERPHEWLQKRKAEIGSFAFASEYMNDPKLDMSAPIKQEHIRYWEQQPSQMNLVIAVDPAYSEDVKSDYKVAVLVGCDEKNNHYLIDYVRTHNPTGEFIDSVLNLYVRHKNYITAVGVPCAGVEREFFKSFSDRASDRQIGCPITELKNAFTATGTNVSIRNKQRRIIAALQPIFEQGRYFIHQNHVEAKEELLTIGSSRWDDIVDAMTYAEQLLTPFFARVHEDNYEQDYYLDPKGGYGVEY